MPFFGVPCFPSQKNKVVEPERAVLPTKTVSRYGETSIKHVNQPLKQEQWKKSARNPNQGRRLPQVPAELRPTYRAPPPPRQMTPPSPTQARPSAQRQAPLRADFFISVPIFTETFDHSYRKKNEFVYNDNRDDEASVYHQSVSRASSLRDLSQKGTTRSTESQPLYSTMRSLPLRRRPRSAQRMDLGTNDSLNRSFELNQKNRHGSRLSGQKHRRRPQSGSEASYNTYSSRGSYEDEKFDKAVTIKQAPKKRGILIESDDEDER